jgi:16S rRNA (guanine527-N7)-methyltransferase
MVAGEEPHRFSSIYKRCRYVKVLALSDYYPYYKNMRNLQPVELLKKGFSELGLRFTEEQSNAFMTYLSELKKWNKAYNLTGLKTDEDIIIKHFLDSLLYLKALPDGTIKVADIGSGAGFPGIPVKIMRPEIKMYLIEPTGKKTAFLKHIIRSLHLNDIHVIEKRIEDTRVSDDIGSPVDAAVTRALFDAREFIENASHIVRQNGILVLSKGPKAEDEVRELREVKYEVLPFTLPLSNNMHRQIIVVNLPKY